MAILQRTSIPNKLTESANIISCGSSLNKVMWVWLTLRNITLKQFHAYLVNVEGNVRSQNKTRKTWRISFGSMHDVLVEIDRSQFHKNFIQKAGIVSCIDSTCSAISIDDDCFKMTCKNFKRSKTPLIINCASFSLSSLLSEMMVMLTIL